MQYFFKTYTICQWNVKFNGALDTLFDEVGCLFNRVVDQEGSIANWTIPGKLVPGMGGAMDLCAGVKKIIVATDHCEKNGQSKILKKCTLPLTGYQCVTDIVTERCYFEVTPEGLVLREVAPGYTVEDILACTDADVIVPDEVGVMQ